ncbi:MAG: DNA-processing protein DprA [Breznakibacter sp.]
MVSEKLKYRIALTQIKGVGPVLARNLVAYLGSEEAVFKEKATALQKIPGIGPVLANDIASAEVMERTERELKFIVGKNIKPVYFTDPEYPQRLNNCDDAPVVLYTLGEHDLNARRILSIVGTRKITEEGKLNCEKLIDGLSQMFPNLLVVSGLAYGVDIWAHRQSLKHGLPTIGVLAHGLDRIYPPMHRQTAVEMLANGGLVTEFMSETGPDKPNFVRRNRIIAGMADAVIVVESGVKGGALITATLASSYNRDVLAFPGRVGDPMSAGCHWLVKHNVAALVENHEDVANALGWESERKGESTVQAKLFVEFGSDEEQRIYQFMLQERETDINWLCIRCNLPVSKVSSVLLGFEFDGLVKSLPGNKFRLI